MTRRYKMNRSIWAEIRADSPNVPQITSQVLVDALQKPEMKPLLEEATARLVPMPDGYVKFYIEARVSDREEEKVIIETPNAELNGIFQRKLRAARLLRDVVVIRFAVISPNVAYEGDRARGGRQYS